ncbi:hypothetical protein AB6A40_005473 [Gnathostoma spinigerum]|uniref:Uncharacterized protein n=1 Tax=Gnathostoma spinigerum TaxID=75299 RepID=A0ABD6EFJ5_9BILA
MKQTIDTLKTNGYPINSSLHLNKYLHILLPYPRVRYTHKKSFQTSLAIPYINNKFTEDFTSILKHNLPIKLIITPPPTLNKLLVRNRIYDKDWSDETFCIICSTNKTGDLYYMLDYMPSSHL